MSKKQIELSNFEKGLYVLALYRGAMLILDVGIKTPRQDREMLRVVDNLVTGMEVFLRVAFPDFEPLIPKIIEKVGKRNFSEDIAQLLRQTRTSWSDPPWTGSMKDNN